MMKPKYWLVLGLAAGAVLQIAGCSSKFSSCERTRTCTPVASDGGEAGSEAEPDNAGQGGVEDNGGSAGAAGELAGAAGAPEECAAGDTEPCWESKSGASFETSAASTPKGNCRLGQRECGKAGSWGTCEGAIGPQPTDTCGPGDDASCNGIPNEGCGCKNDETRLCGTNTTGNCKQGMQTCKNLEWGECVGEVKPAAFDSCVTAGDDASCDGKVNDQCPCIGTQTQNCGDCGTQTCEPGARKWGACSATVAQSACGNCGTRTCNANGSYSACMAAAPQCMDATHSEVCAGSTTFNWVVSACAANTTCSNATCLKNNGQACALGAECSSGQCNIFYRDLDGDGYGTSSSSVLVCGTTPPPGFLANNQDCCDTDSVVHPGQTAYYFAANKCGSFDYDCVNGVQLEIPTKSVCEPKPSCLTGWPGEELPECGTKAVALGYHASSGFVYQSTSVFCH